MNREAWWATSPWGHKKSEVTFLTFTCLCIVSRNYSDTSFISDIALNLFILSLSFLDQSCQGYYV